MGSHSQQILNSNKQIIKAGCVAVNDNGEILALFNHEESAYLPKGHAEAGETMSQVAARETREETGYKVKIIKELGELVYIHGETGEPINVTWYLAKPEEQVGEPEDTLRWLTLEELLPSLRSNVADFLLRHKSELR